MKTGRILVIVGCVLSFGTALLHGAPYRVVSAAISGSNAPPTTVAAFKCLWLAFSVQFILLSAIAAAALGSARAKQIVLLCALLPALDAGLMYFFLGPFIGAYCVTGVAACLLAGGLLQPDPQSA
ncbi:MAG TPA: hypothetical protein VMI93_08015 [Candidatus Solibacter sp.]|nr:hypothetical protein [Candidatus Solibacter sp.]